MPGLSDGMMADRHVDEQTAEFMQKEFAIVKQADAEKLNQNSFKVKVDYAQDDPNLLFDEATTKSLEFENGWSRPHVDDSVIVTVRDQLRHLAWLLEQQMATARTYGTRGIAPIPVAAASYALKPEDLEKGLQSQLVASAGPRAAQPCAKPVTKGDDVDLDGVAEGGIGPRAAKPCSQPGSDGLEPDVDLEMREEWATSLAAAAQGEEAPNGGYVAAFEGNGNHVQGVNGAGTPQKEIAAEEPRTASKQKAPHPPQNEGRKSLHDDNHHHYHHGHHQVGKGKSKQTLDEQFQRICREGENFLTPEDVQAVMSKHGQMHCKGHELPLEDFISMMDYLCTCKQNSESGPGERPKSSRRPTSFSSALMDFDTFTFLVNSFEGTAHDGAESRHLLELRRAFHNEAQDHFMLLTKQRIEEKEEATKEPGPRGYMALALDTLPAIMIMLNALVIGISADTCPDCRYWEYVELIFLVFFTGEFVVKIRLFGCRVIMLGIDKWWNYFDLFCIFTAFMDVGITHMNRMLSGTETDMGGLMLIKMLRLARLARLVRLLRFKIFNELKMMVQGVVSGVRVLCWAIVLLFFCIFLLGILMRKMVGEDQPEFSTLPAAMFSLFRCFTDGCVAYNGTPLQERLRFDYGMVWMIGYILVFLFVTIGIFNLIMAIFIDNVVTAHVQRKQQTLGENAARMECKITEVIARRFAETRRVQIEEQMHLTRASFVGALHTSLLNLTPEGREEAFKKKQQEVEEELAGLEDEDIVITKDIFNTWLSDPEVLDLLETIEVETSTKYELFDALDVDSGGELNAEELVSGLMRLRGPISKNDIVATRLKVAYITELIEEICRKLGIDVAD
eukprot:TRINITY_DN6421_c0_g4_i1.p1 TRINITY_DN6421_c0_g4~~TRINITY_DN6421_c0_g4_i1.p1  ORF type:complete len:846 (+),score=238.92 TRINITY_DN6421_c0_g4_i1:173-2710(+)